jgi:putative salt-induced outer membrane protein YdiY
VRGDQPAARKTRNKKQPMTLTHKIALACGLVAMTTAGFAQSAPTATETNLWKTSAAAGLTLTRGNSDSTTFTANLLASRKWTENELDLGVDGTYGKANGVKNAESLHGFGQYNRLFSDRFFGLMRVDALHDAVADLDYRLTLSPGVGYYFIKNKTTFLRGEVGPGFVYEKLGGETDSYATLRVAERFEHTFTEHAKMWQSLEWLPQVDDFNNYVINAEVGLDTAITKKLSLRTFLQDTFDNEPAPGRKKNDLKLVSALAYTF